MSESSAVKKYVAELIGTLVLVLMGCGSAVLAGRNFGGLAGIGAVGISFAFGISVLAMAYAIGGISGCHINPAVSISMFFAIVEAVFSLSPVSITFSSPWFFSDLRLYSIAVG